MFFYIMLILLILSIGHCSIRTLSIFCNFYSTTVLGWEPDRSRFGCLACQQIGWPVRVSGGRFAGRTDSHTGLCPIPLSKRPLNRPGRFARRPDRRFGRRANRSEHIHERGCTYCTPSGSGCIARLRKHNLGNTSPQRPSLRGQIFHGNLQSGHVRT